MDNNWPTKDNDMQVARQIIAAYAESKNTDVIGLIELVVDTHEKRMDFRLARWVTDLAFQFNFMYGLEQGNSITRRVISRCITQGETLH